MNILAERSPLEQLEIPPVGGAVIVSILFPFITFFVTVAVFNLTLDDAQFSFESLLSVIWLLIVAIGLVGAIVEAGGVRQWAINILGMYSRRGFVLVKHHADGPPLLCYGFDLFKRKFDYLQIDVGRIGVIDWSAGQASDMSGRDIDDWSIAVWCHRGKDSSTWDHHNRSKMKIHIVGPQLSRQEANGLGHSLVAFLGRAGVRLEPSDKKTEFLVDRKNGMKDPNA